MTEPTRAEIVLLARLDALKSAITQRDWAATEFQFDRVLSQALRMSGQRDRPYDNPLTGDDPLAHLPPDVRDRAIRGLASHGLGPDGEPLT